MPCGVGGHDDGCGRYAAPSRAAPPRPLARVPAVAARARGGSARGPSARWLTRVVVAPSARRSAAGGGDAARLRHLPGVAGLGLGTATSPPGRRRRSSVAGGRESHTGVLDPPPRPHRVGVPRCRPHPHAGAAAAQRSVGGHAVEHAVGRTVVRLRLSRWKHCRRDIVCGRGLGGSAEPRRIPRHLARPANPAFH